MIAPIAAATPLTSSAGTDVARSAKNATVPTTSTVSAAPMKERSTVAIDSMPKGTPHAIARMTGARMPTAAAAMSTAVIG